MDARREVINGTRFGFGDNWKSFLGTLDGRRIDDAVRSLSEMLKLPDLTGQRFLDVGSGSGLFSLAARRLGAEVVSFDYDPVSVGCTMELRRRYYPEDPSWQIHEGSVLDVQFLELLGRFDIVYSWGVLHHTGDMWAAIDNVTRLVARGGIVFISIYNAQGIRSTAWMHIKKRYNASGSATRRLMIATVDLIFRVYGLRCLPQRIFSRRSGVDDPGVNSCNRFQRGMDRRHDLKDWVGGFPYEVATPDEILRFFSARGFRLVRSNLCGSLGCNEFVFEEAAGSKNGSH